MVGRFGMLATRCAVVTASATKRPERTNGSEVAAPNVSCS